MDVQHAVALARELGCGAHHFVRRGVQGVGSDADVGFGMAFHELARALGGDVCAFAKLRRRIVGVHPGTREDEADSGVVGSLDGGLGACVALTVEIEEFGDGRDAGGKHLGEGGDEGPVDVVGRQLRDDAI